MPLEIEKIAEIAYETNVLYANAIGKKEPGWAKMKKDDKQMAINDAQFYADNPSSLPDALHNVWLREMEENGYQYGEQEDGDEKTHPHVIPYEQLPDYHRKQATLFRHVVVTLALGE